MSILSLLEGSNYSTFFRHQYMKGCILCTNLALLSYIIFNKFYLVIKAPSQTSLIINKPNKPTLFSPYLEPFVWAGLLFTWVPLSRLLRVNYLFIVNVLLQLMITDYTFIRVCFNYYLICILQAHIIIIKMHKISTQVMIAGCGPVGLTLANCLVRSPFIDSITLLDRKIPKDTRQLPRYSDQRVFSINEPSLRLFQNLKVLPTIRQKGIMSKIQVVSKQSLSCVNWSQNRANIMQNDQIVYALKSNLRQYQSKISYIQDEVQSISKSEQDCTVRLKNNKEKELKTKLLVGSDGITSNIKRLSGITHYGWQYRQKAIVCTMKIDSKYDNTSAYQIYHDGNVLAILPLWDSYVSLVWSLGLPDFQHLMKIQSQQFRTKLNNVIKNSNHYMKTKMGYMQIPQILQIINKRLSFPLSTLQSSYYTQERIALVGDAAHTIHPMAGLGVNSGIMDSILLANNIIRNVKTGNDIGDLLALSNYEAKAKIFNYKNSLAMETIKKVFQTDLWGFNKLRGFGMDIAQNSQLIKQVMKDAVDDKQLKYQWQNTQTNSTSINQ